MITAERTSNEQTPGQWAVRWHGVALAALLVGSVPVVHLTWHGILGRVAPPVVTRSQVPMPAIELATVQSGAWMTGVDSYLREASPIVWNLRGSWNEALLRCGIVQNTRVHLGRDNWLFQMATVHPDVRKFDADSAARRRVFAAVRDRVRAAGAELVVALVPDKARVYPDFAYADGAIGATKAPLYGRALQELRDEGVVAVDLATALGAARAVSPGQQFYYARDTHWRPEGAFVAAQAVAAVVAGLPVASKLQPRRPVELSGRSTVVSLGDLVAMLGLLTVEVPLIEDRTRTLPMSLLTTDLVENRDFYAAIMRVDGVSVEPVVEDPDTEVLLLGTSFSEANGAGALALALGRPVRLVMEHGASGLAAVERVADELQQGTKAKLVVWEIVERGLMEGGWQTVRL